MGKDLKGKVLEKGISQRKDGRYEARATIRGHKIDIYSFNLAELKKSFEEEKRKVYNKENIYNDNITFKEWYLEWFTKCKAPNLKSDISRRSYDRKIRNTYVRILGNKKMVDVLQIDIQGATSQLFDDGYSTRTVKEAISILKDCFENAVINHLINFNPCIGINVKNDNVKPKEKRVLTLEEQKIFLEKVKNSYYFEAYAILLSTGMRIGEFSALQWEDIDFDKKCININHSMQTDYYKGTKTEKLTTPKTLNSYRAIPFFGETSSLLKAWKKKQEKYKKQLGDRWRSKPEYGNLVFTNTMGAPITRYVLAHDIKKVVRNINLQEIYKASREGRKPKEFKSLHPHAFRHTFATRCFEKKLDPLFIQNIMGHSNYSTTISYTHVLDEEKQNQVIKVGDFLS